MLQIVLFVFDQINFIVCIGFYCKNNVHISNRTIRNMMRNMKHHVTIKKQREWDALVSRKKMREPVWHSNERKARFFMHVVVCVCFNENLKKTECTKWKMNNILSLNNISVGSLEMFAWFFVQFDLLSSWCNPTVIISSDQFLFKYLINYLIKKKLLCWKKKCV